MNNIESFYGYGFTKESSFNSLCNKLCNCFEITEKKEKNKNYYLEIKNIGWFKIEFIEYNSILLSKPNKYTIHI